jgi:hypothetical protein
LAANENSKERFKSNEFTVDAYNALQKYSKKTNRFVLKIIKKIITLDNYAKEFDSFD